jgi:glycosyltransferase involved in cell wall biosynthesis
MRVLVGMPDPSSLGGPATCEPPLVAALRDAGIDVREEVYVYGDRFDGITLLQRVRRVLRTARHFRRTVRAERFDLVHLNTAFDVKALLRDVVCVLAIRRHTRRLLLKLHGSDPGFVQTSNLLLRLLRRLLLSRVDAIAVLSTEERSSMLALGLPPHKVVVVKNAIEPATVEPQRPARPVLLFVARMVATKGLIDVVRACGILAAAGRDFELLCVGDGPERAGAESEAASLGLSGRTRFPGYVPEAETTAFYATSTALVFPTQTEGFSLTIFNAVACGLPVLTTRIRAAADYLAEPDNCLWVRPHDPSALAERIETLLEDEPLQRSMSRNNRELARRFTAASIVGEYVDLYRSLVDGSRG